MNAETVHLPGGRSLCLARFGDPGGFPLFYFHGWPGSRLEAGLLAQLPACVIALDRPGYGGSAPQASRRLLDWPADVAAVADFLGIGRFAVLGVSGGGPYAVACAYALPERVLAASLMCPVPPASALEGRATRFRADLSLLLRLGRHPRVARPLLTMARRLAFVQGLVNPASIRCLGPMRLAPRDMQALSVPVITQILASFREGIRPGIEGILSDARIYAQPWGFPLGDVTLPMRVWHGTADTIVPVFTSEAYAALPCAERRLLEGEGHYSLILAHGRRVIDALLDDLHGRAAA